MNHLTGAALRCAVALLVVGGCSKPSAVSQSRTYLLGFSATPPRLTIESVLQNIDTWTPRADAGLLALSVPWKSMLADTSASFIIRREQVELVALYRSRGKTIVAMVDATDGRTTTVFSRVARCRCW